MRKIKLFGAILFLFFALAGTSTFAQGDVGIIGLMHGRITKADGRGVGGVAVSVVALGSCFDWAGNTTRTNPFGYYRVNVHYDCGLLVMTNRKGLNFTPNSMVISIDSNYSGIDFLAY